MRLTAPLYEGDGLLRSGPAFGADEAPAVTGRPAEVTGEAVIEAGAAAPEYDLTRLEARARAMRAAYLGAALARLWRRFEAWLEEGRRQREEAYLARAANLSDLEERLRRLERRGLVSYI